MRGGAVLVESADFTQRRGRLLQAKRRIAEADGLTAMTNGLATFQVSIRSGPVCGRI